MMVYEYITRYDFEEHIKKCSEVYGRRCELMLSEMDKHFPKECTYSRPEGGIFILCTMPEGTDTNKMLKAAIDKNVAFVPGNSFMIDIESPSNIFRLNYSVTNEDSIVKGIDILSEVIKDFVK